MRIGPYEANEIYCGHNVDLMAAMTDGCVDLTVTSPPYDNLRTYNGFTFDFEGVARELYRVTKPGGVVVWVVADATINGSETGTSFRQALHFMSLGFNLHDTMIYKTNKPPLTHNRYEQCFEYMFIFSRGTPDVFNPIMIRSLHADKVFSLRTFRHNSSGELGGFHSNKPVKDRKIIQNVWHIETGNNGATTDKIAFKHPAIFPEALARDHVLSWSNPGALVFDPFIGSGTTAKAARQLGRDYLGFDISQEYVDLARERLGATTPALLVEAA